MRKAPLALLLAAAVAVAGCGSSTHPSPHLGTTGPTQFALGSVHPPGWGVTGPVSSPSNRLTLAPGLHTMYDDVTVSVIPAGAFAAAGYTAGLYNNFAELTRDFPRAHKIAVAIKGNVPGDCLDVEPGDAEPWEAPLWIKDGHRCIYSDWFDFTHKVIPALQGAGIDPASVLKWDAHLGSPHLDAGFQATQYDFHCLGLNLDCSVVTPAFLAIAHPPLNPCNARCARLRGQVAVDRWRIGQDTANARTDSRLVAFWLTRRPQSARLRVDEGRRRNDRRYLETRIGVLRAQIRIDQGRLR